MLLSLLALGYIVFRRLFNGWSGVPEALRRR
jgi:hypothetical protein